MYTDTEKSLGDTAELWFETTGTLLLRSPPHTQDQNGAAERSGGVIISRSRAMQTDAKLPYFMWPEIVCAAGYILNRTPRQKHGWKTPLETLHAFVGYTDTKPKCGQIRLYGCRAYALKNDIKRTDKLVPRSQVGYLVGYDSSNIFRIWVPQLHRVIRSRDVTFDESIQYRPSLAEEPISQEITETVASIEIQDSDDDDTEFMHQIRLSTAPTTPYVPGTASRTIQSSQNLKDYVSPYPPTQTDATGGLITPEGSPAPVSHDDDNQLSRELTENSSTLSPAPTAQLSPDSARDSDDATIIVDTTPYSTQPGINPQLTPMVPTDVATPSIPSRRQYDTSQGINPANIVTAPRQRNESWRKQAHLAAVNAVESLIGYHTAFLAGTLHQKALHRTELPEPPTSWHHLEIHPYADGFKSAAQKEYDDLVKRNTWKHVDHTETTSRPLPLKWVFTYKFDTDGYLDKLKARLCVRGDLQPWSHRDNYAATLAAKVFRALMAIAAYFDLEAVQLDAVSAFTNALMDETVFTQCPDGFKVPGKNLLLLRALYGLRRSPLIWLNEFSSTLSRLGLTQIPESQCLFSNGKLIVFFYVDDVVILYHRKHEAEYQEFLQALLATYEFKQLGALKWFLGIRILRDRTQRLLWLCQDAYIEKVARSFNQTNGPNFKTPMSTTTT